jgi:hypothetical protein
MSTTGNNFVFGAPNWFDLSSYFDITLSGGSFLTTLPRDNVMTEFLTEVARTTNDNTSSTQFDVLFEPAGGGTLILPVGVVGLAIANPSTACQIRVRGSEGTNPTVSTTIDTGWVSLFPYEYDSGDLDWEDLDYWTGTVPGHRKDNYAYHLFAKSVITSPVAGCRSMRFELDDTDSDDGFLDIQRVFAGPGWQSTQKMSLGARLGFRNRTSVVESIGGAKHYNRRPSPKVWDFSVNMLNSEEGFTRAFEMIEEQGIDRQCIFIFDPTDTKHSRRRNIICTLQQMSPIEMVATGSTQRHRIAFRAEEVIG